MDVPSDLLRDFFLSRPLPEQLPSKVTAKWFRLVGDAEEPGSFIFCDAVFLHAPCMPLFLAREQRHRLSFPPHTPGAWPCRN